MAPSFLGGHVNRDLVYRLLAGAAVVVQVLLVFYFFVMGLGWGGFWYVANLAQGLAILAAAAVLLWRRPLWVLPLPVVSLLLMLAFHAVDPSTKTTACTQAELSAVAELPPPPGTPPLEFQSEPAIGCIARFPSAMSGDQLIDHYRRTATVADWVLEPAAGGQIETGAHVPHGPGALAMSKDGMRVSVSYEPSEESGSGGSQLWVVVEVSEPGR
jgi:hypothetical protein